MFVYNDQGSSYAPGWREIWTSTSDGASSGLDADLLDGEEGSYYLNYNNLTNTPTIPTNTNYYLNGISKSGNTLTFSVNGTTNQTYTFGSNAFNSTTIPTNNNQLTNGAGYLTQSSAFNNQGQAHSTRTSFATGSPSFPFGFNFVQGNGNSPGVNSAAQYYSLYTGLGSQYPATGSGSYGMELAIPRGVSSPYIAIRYNENNSLGSWQKISAGYADSAGSVAWGNVTGAPTIPTNYITNNADDTMVGDLTIDKGTSTTLSVKCDNGGNALIRAGGDGQGTGIFEVTQDNGSHGGGMSYNGDGTPAWVSGETSDHVTFYRINAGTRTEVFHYPYSSDTVNFNSVPTVGGTALPRLNVDNAGELRATNFKANNGGVYYAYTSSGALRGYMYATETNDEHLVLQTSGGEDIAFKDASATNMIIRPNSQVQIGAYGDANPSLTLAASQNGASEIRFNDINSTEGSYIKSSPATGSTGGDIYFGSRWNTDTDRIYFEMTTDVVTTPNTMFNLASGSFQFGGENNAKELNSAQISAGQHQDNSMNFVGMASGTTSTDRRMDFWVEGGAYFRGNVIATGNVTAYGSASDKRLKKDIIKIDNAIDKIKSVSGYEFAWNENAPQDKQDKREFGVIAQEVEEAGLDKLVFEYTRPVSGTDEETKDLPDEKWKAVHYDKFVPILIEAVKEQQEQIEELKSIINTLVESK